jgi:hypothetical protein
MLKSMKVRFLMELGYRVDKVNTIFKFYWWKIAEKNDTMCYRNIGKNGVYNADPHVSERYEGLAFENSTFVSLKSAHQRLTDKCFVLPEPIAMSGSELYRLYSGSHVGLSMLDDGYVSIACPCNSNLVRAESNENRYYECVGVQLDHKTCTVSSLTMRDGTIVDHLDEKITEYARIHAQIGYWHFMGIHAHNYVHFHLNPAFVVAVNEGTFQRRSSVTNQFLNPHIRFTLLTNNHGLSGSVTDGYQTNAVYKPITPTRLDQSMFDDLVFDMTSRFFNQEPYPETKDTHLTNMDGKHGLKRRLVYGFPFSYDGCSLLSLDLHNKEFPMYAKTLSRYYRAYYTYFASMRHSLNQTELDEIQRRTATLMGTTGAEQVRNATSIDFYATCMFLAGAFHSTDHGICNAVVSKYKFPAFSTSPYGTECKPWDRECLVVSDNFRRIAIANIGKEFYKSISHRQDLIKPLHELKGHGDALKRLNQSLELAKHELCAYVGVDSFHIYPSVSH